MATLKLSIKIIFAFVAITFSTSLVLAQDTNDTTVELPTAEIHAKDAHALLQVALRRIGQNYATQRVAAEAVYHESVKLNGEALQNTEALCDFRLAAYTPTWDWKNARKQYYANWRNAGNASFLSGRWYEELTNPDEQVRIVAARNHTQSTQANWNVRVAGGPVGLLAYDKVKYPTFFLSNGTQKIGHIAYKDYQDMYTFDLAGKKDYRGYQTYLITFTPKVANNNAVLFAGQIYLDVESLAFVGIEYQNAFTNEQYPIDGDIVHHTLHQVKVYYQKIGDKWYLSEINLIDKMQLADRDTKKIDKTLETASRLQVQQIDAQNITQITGNEAFTNQIGNFLYDYAQQHNATVLNEASTPTSVVKPRTTTSQKGETSKSNR